VISADQIRHRLKLRHLNVLLAVAEQGSMVKAAEQLAVSQPVVSKAIADLERMVGFRLLERGQRGVEPTAFGQALLKRSVAIFDDLRTSVRELQFLADPTTGELRIGSTEAMGTALVPNIIDRMSRQYPRIRFEVVLGPPEVLYERELRGRRVDLVIGQRITSGFDATEVDVTILYQDRLCVAAGMSHPCASRRKIELADLVDKRWCLPPQSHPVGALVYEAFRNSGLPYPRSIVTAPSAPFTFSLISSGQYLGILGLLFLGAYVRRGVVKVLPVKPPIRQWPISILTLKNRAPNPVTKLFIDFARQVANSLANAKIRR
jgi:DNA-binding transcriptional LysR family regulator